MDASKMSATKLKSLNTKPYIQIRCKADQNAEAIILFEAFPKGLALAFSKVARQTFPSITAMTQDQLAQPKSAGILVIGSSRYIREVFLWMLKSAQGTGIEPIRSPDSFKYCNYVKLRTAARAVEVQVLDKRLSARITFILSQQVHSEDIEHIYAEPATKNMDVRKAASESIANAIWEKRCKARPAYTMLREKYPEFDADLNARFDILKAELTEKRRVANVDCNNEGPGMRAERRQLRSVQQGDESGKGGQKNIKEADRIQNENKALYEDEVVNSKMSLPLARRRKNGRSFYKISLAQAGVTDDDFRQRENVGFKFRPWTSNNTAKIPNSKDKVKEKAEPRRKKEKVRPAGAKKSTSDQSASVNPSDRKPQVEDSGKGIDATDKGKISDKETTGSEWTDKPREKVIIDKKKQVVTVSVEQVADAAEAA